MAIKQISSQEAKELLESERDYIYIDVRSEMEFQQGHPTNSKNIPIKHFNTVSQMLEDNLEYLEVVEANFPKDAKLIIGCNSGIRSQVACEMLEQKGYKNLANMLGGFGGARDMFGNIIQKGWLELGFSVSYGNVEEGSYDSLRKKTNRTTEND